MTKVEATVAILNAISPTVVALALVLLTAPVVVFAIAKAARGAR